MSSLKGVHVEELLNLLFYRPLAFLLVKLIYPFPITPNQISMMAIIPGILSGYYFSRGDARSFFIAGVLLGLSSILDCADGMIARLKKNGTKTGRLVDGVVDYTVSVFVYIGLAIGLSRAINNGWMDFPFDPWGLLAVVGVCNMIHAGLADHYRNLYDAHVYGKRIIPQIEIREFSTQLKHLNEQKGKYIDKLLIKIYLVYLRAQAGKKVKAFVRFDPQEYKKYNRKLLFLWNFIGHTTHLSFFIISALFYNPMIFFYYTIVFANLWMLGLFPLQGRANNKTSITG